MATRASYNWSEIKAENPLFSQIRTTIETPFYGNNVVQVNSIMEAYKLAYNSPGTVVTDIPVFEPEKLGLDANTKVLLFNDGNVKGRCAAARRILGSEGVDQEEYATKLRQAVYNTHKRTMYHAQVYVGLDKDFIVKAHLLIPEGEENLMYSWMLNFQHLNEDFFALYNDSTKFENEGDIYIFSDPNWAHEDHPLGG